jgi:hypothetical protein
LNKHQFFDANFLPLYYVHIYFFLFTQHELPFLYCSEDDCLADFVLRKDARLNNQGACSLEFQSVLQILTENMLKWKTKTKTSTGKGILGTVRAFAGADEEQGPKNSLPTLANLGGGNRSNIKKCSV